MSAHYLPIKMENDGADGKDVGVDRPDTEPGDGAGEGRRRRRPSFSRTDSYWNTLQTQYCCHRNVFCKPVPGMLLEYEFPWYRQLLLVGVGLFYFIDVGLDVFVAATYLESYLNEREENALNYFIATTFFIVVPNVLIQLMSWFLYFWSFYLCNNLGPLALQKRFLTIHRHHNTTSHVVALACHEPSCTENKETLPPPSARRRHRSQSQSSQVKIISPRGSLPSASEPLPSTPNARATSPHVDIDLENTTVRFVNSDSVFDGVEAVDYGPKFQPMDYIRRKKEFGLLSVLHLCVLGYPARIWRLLWFTSLDPFTYFRYHDVSFLRLMEAFMEAAPQAILQLYLMQVQEETILFYKIITPLSIISSVVTLAFAVADFASAGKDVLAFIPINVGNVIRPIAQDDLQRERMTWTAYFVYILWHLFMISSRMLAISFFAAEYGAYVLIILGTHYLIMVWWMYHQTGTIFQLSGNKGCKSKCGFFNRYLIEFIAAAFNIFFFFSMLDTDEEEDGRGQALAHTIVYHVLIFLENFIMTILWYIAVDLGVWYSHPGLAVVIVCYVVGGIFMIVYYGVLSPKKVALQRSIHREFRCCSNHHTSNANKVKRFTSTLNWFFNHDEAFKRIRRNQTILY